MPRKCIQIIKVRKSHTKPTPKSIQYTKAFYFMENALFPKEIKEIPLLIKLKALAIVPQKPTIPF